MPQFTGGNYYDIMYHTQSVVKVGVISYIVASLLRSTENI